MSFAHNLVLYYSNLIYNTHPRCNTHDNTPFFIKLERRERAPTSFRKTSFSSVKYSLTSSRPLPGCGMDCTFTRPKPSPPGAVSTSFVGAKQPQTPEAPKDTVLASRQQRKRVPELGTLTVPGQSAHCATTTQCGCASARQRQDHCSAGASSPAKPPPRCL